MALYCVRWTHFVYPDQNLVRSFQSGRCGFPASVDTIRVERRERGQDELGVGEAFHWSSWTPSP
jgi:hypothetical protein